MNNSSRGKLQIQCKTYKFVTSFSLWLKINIPDIRLIPLDHVTYEIREYAFKKMLLLPSTYYKYPFAKIASYQCWKKWMFISQEVSWITKSLIVFCVFIHKKAQYPGAHFCLSLRELMICTFPKMHWVWRPTYGYF